MAARDYRLPSRPLLVTETGHQLIQPIPSEGVLDRHTDQQTYSWASQGWPRYRFTLYGFLPGVRY